ncbi:septum site-determining protein MinC [Methylococcus capsulatus str. Bath]|uniref:Probable septum site-determining protein MinC n=1 Tax=Methylococcus capsulatus (strain ATCC 33009 / NCIMB 11132 / Bath) TaxID=243233 RepID=Q602J7_METCA|nr:septum site-determining protein MinC [Methylococcus capsulatus]AAU90852.1 septum site-determining protein MinC [Methylococcus capsulatus str. Bath]
MLDPSQAHDVPFEIRAGSFNLPVLKLTSDSADAIAGLLAARVQQAPDFFRHAPVILDLHELATRDHVPDFDALLQILRGSGLTPVGVRGGNAEQNAAADAAGLALLAEGKHHESHPATESPHPTPEPIRPPRQGTKIIDQPIRSGQRVYANDGDLVVIATVSPGAELMADGNIHVYGSLRGRAMAGVKGDLDARIFCLDLQAELIAIGGHYKVSENLDGTARGRPVQIMLRDNALIIQDL